jgi:DNA-binding FadR family transcriptional regulator
LYKIASIHLKKWFKSIYSEINPLMKTHALHEQLAKHIIAGEPEKARDAAEKIIEQS